MAKNDLILLDGLISERASNHLPSGEKDEAFEYFSLEQILKSYDLSREEIESGWVDGADDGGIDGFFTFINGVLADDPESLSFPRSNVELSVHIITCKLGDSFKQLAVNNILASVEDLFDLSKERKDLRGSYSEDLLDARETFAQTYRKASLHRARLAISFSYACRGDTKSIASNISSRAARVESTTRELFSSCNTTFEFLGSAELVGRYRHMRPFSLSLPFQEALAGGEHGYVVLARLDDFCKFITDERGEIRRYLFDSNVRDYLGDNAVNEGISSSLRDQSGPEFWWLNNGVTILATHANAVGKTLQLQDIQIVNGLQTTESIFKHFQGGETRSRDKRVIVKIVVSGDPRVRDQIIRATNSQSQVEPASLHATDKIQRDIEEILERHGWFYERRKNYYRNVGKPAERFVTPLFLAGGVIALLLRSPSRASKVKAKVLKKQESYSAIFSDKTPIEFWPKLVSILKKIEHELPTLKESSKFKTERFLARWRNLLAVLLVGRDLGTFDFSAEEIIARVNPDAWKLDRMKETWEVIEEERGADTTLPIEFDRRSNARTFIPRVLRNASKRFGVRRPEAMSRFDFMDSSHASRGEKSGQKRPSKPELTEEVLSAVDAALPSQPWIKGVQSAVVQATGLDVRVVRDAITELIRLGRRSPQKDGKILGRTD